MTRTGVLQLIAVCLAAYGVYVALFVPALLVGAPAPLVLAGFVAEAATAFLSAAGVWAQTRWAPAALIALGAAIAVTELIEGPVLGLVAYGYAIVVAAVALLITLGLATCVGRSRVRIV